MVFALMLWVPAWPSTTRGDEPLQATVSDQRMEARLNDRVMEPGQGKTEQQKDLRLTKAVPAAPRPAADVRAKAEGATLREQKTKRVAAAQN
ncbi:MAG: hypothetical protein K8T26_08540 [Lentisphaerae bacterium]|nr:hypothetical protein [Lentisphaerota bacterium]